jgi:TonB family protein
MILLAAIASSFFSASTPALEVMRVDLTQLDLPAPEQAKAPPVTPPKESAPKSQSLPPEEMPQPEPEIAEQLVPPTPKLPPAPKEETPKPKPETKPQPKEAESVPSSGEPASASDAVSETAPQSISEGTSMKMRAHEGVADYYFALLSRKISRRWEITQASMRGRRGVEAVVRFRVGSAGEIQDAEIARGSGLSVFDRQCLAAVIAANPLPAPPVQYLRSGSLPIELTFTFNP